MTEQKSNLARQIYHTFSTTVNGERFAGLNFRGFHPMKFFTGKLSWCLMFTTLKQHHYTKLVNIHGKIFAVLLKTVKNAKV